MTKKNKPFDDRLLAEKVWDEVKDYTTTIIIMSILYLGGWLINTTLNKWAGIQ